MYMCMKKKAKTEGEGAQPVELSVTAAQIVSLSPFGEEKKKSRCFPASKMCRKAEGFEWTNPEILVAL